jgi:hydrogenase expression/formation protein HypE
VAPKKEYNMNKILLSHGGGGQKTTQLIQQTIHKYFNDPMLDQMDDSAFLGRINGETVFTTDSFVVNPIFFPGGDIGDLAVSGTVNDLSVMGAKPLFLSVGFIIEEGLELEKFEKILDSMSKAAQIAGIRIVTGDTKVVEKGKCDGIYINTSGIGEIVFKNPPSANRVEVGDVVLINGPIGLHEVSVLTARNEFGLETKVESDVVPLWPMIETLSSLDIKFMRDPTRGGMAQLLNEVVQGRKFGVHIDETSLPVTTEVAGVCEILGFDILHLANEGKVIVIVSKEDAKKALELMENHPLGKGAAIIGGITSANPGMVILKTTALSERIVMPPTGELVPRIC